MQVDGAAHHLADVHGAVDHLLAFAGQHDMLRTDAQHHGAGRSILGGKPGLLFIAEDDMGALQVDGILAVGVPYQRGVKGVHAGHTDKAGHKQVGGMVKDLLRGAHLLDDAVLHDDDAVAQRHGLGLVVGHINKSGIDALPQLDDLGAHLVAEFGVQVGKRLVHQKDLGVADDGAADGHTLPLAAGKRLGLAVQVLGDIQDLGGLPHLAVDLRLIHLAQLEPEGHVIVNGHVGVQGVVLEYHGDIPILGGNVVDQLAVDIQLTAGDLLQTGDHPQGGGFTAAGGADQYDKFVILDLQVKILDSQNALFGDLQVALLFRLAFFLAFLVFQVGVDFFDVFQYDVCHFFRSGQAASAYLASRRGKRASPRLTAGLHTAAPGASGWMVPPFFRPGRPSSGVAGGIGLIAQAAEARPVSPIVALYHRNVNESPKKRPHFCEYVINRPADLADLTKESQAGGFTRRAARVYNDNETAELCECCSRPAETAERKRDHERTEPSGAQRGILLF